VPIHYGSSERWLGSAFCAEGRRHVATPFPLVNAVSPWQRPRMAELDKRIAAIKRAMKRTKLGQNEVARRAGVAKSTVSRILNGERSPSAKILFALEAVALRAVAVVCEK